TTAMTVSQARGVVLLCARLNQLEIFEYTPMQIKLAIAGYGKADKKQMQEMVRVLLKLKEIPKPDDAADALAAALTYASTAMLRRRSGVCSILFVIRGLQAPTSNHRVSVFGPRNLPEMSGTPLPRQKGSEFFSG